MRRIVPILLILVSLIAPPKANGAGDFIVKELRSDIAIEATGKVFVTERVEVDFSADKHGIFRDIPHAYRDNQGTETYTEISVHKVTNASGQPVPYSTSINNAYLRLQIGDPNRTVTGRQSYLISYTATGILRSFDAYDELYWNATGNAWETTVERATATVSLPNVAITQAACYEGRSGSTENCSNQQNLYSATFTATRPLAPGEGLTVAVGYTKGAVPILAVSKPMNGAQVSFNAQEFLIPFAVSTLLGLFLVFYVWSRFGRDRRFRRTNDPGSGEEGMPFAARETVAPEYSSPEGLRPAEIGVLKDETADTMDVTATIVDLAVRGYLSIKEESKKVLIFNNTDYTLQRTDKDTQGLLTYETVLLKALFQEGSTVKLSDLRNTFYEDLGVVKDELYKEVTNKKLFIGNPATTRVIYGLLDGLVIVIGTGFLISGIVAKVPVLAGIGAGLCVSGAVGMPVALTMPRRSAYGHELFRRALGYKLFVSGTEKYRQPYFENQNIFMEVLPYAIVFGVTKKLAKAFEEMGIEPPQPAWYTGSHAWNAMLFTNALGSFSNSLSSTMASTPGGSGSGGGGFSGGGFGGGGGGSW